MSGLTSDITVRAPSNIALVKYMGKVSADGNIPANSSLSMTLNSLCTVARVRKLPAGGVSWDETLISERECIDGLPARIPHLSEKGKERILRHVRRTLDQAPAALSNAGLVSALPKGLSLGAANTFPAASGIASSASSFAAVTLAVTASCARDIRAFWRAWDESPEFRRALAVISRQGSGSSCRSMEGAYVQWSGERAVRVDHGAMPAMVDLVLLAGREEKEVSSSEAHRRVLGSPLWQGRVERAEKRIELVERAIYQGDLAALARVVWEESWEMHSLFHTSVPPFTYWLPRSLEILRYFAPHVTGAGDLAPPIVTMDAGPNVHVLVPESAASVWRARIESAFPGLEILQDRAGLGAEPLAMVGPSGDEA